MIIIHTGAGRKTDRQEPGKDFERQIEEHKGMHGTRCDFVEYAEDVKKALDLKEERDP